MINPLLPAGVASAESFVLPGLTALPAEESIIGRAVEKRRKEFITARSCARVALGELGIDPVPIMRGEKDMPLWPDGIVGSITHTNGYRAAIVAHGLAVRSLGIDAEPHEPLPTGSSTSPASPKNATSWPPGPRVCTGTGCCSAPKRPPTRRGSR